MLSKIKSRRLHPEEIKAAIRKRGVTLVSLAQKAGLPPHSCQHALRFPNAEGEAVIAKFLGISAAEIWPHRFERDGTRRHQIRLNRKSTRITQHSHRENQEAA